MNAVKFTLFALVFFSFQTVANAQFISVDDTYTAQQLVENVLINSPCANVQNFTVNGDPFSGSQQSYGYFNRNASSFPFAEGIVLSTARANRAPGPNDNLIDEGQTNWLGDSDLEQALGISNTFNATVLEFDFTPLTNQVSFDYIFASEEYQGSAPCRYSDGFAFLLREAASPGPYTNLAVLPNSNTPVLVTSVHPPISAGGGCSAQNEQYFAGYNNASAPINFNGQTVVLTAKSSVTPNVRYHIKLVIADHENIRYDSAIFLGGGTFRVGANLGPDRLLASQNPVCDGETYILDATQTGSNTYKWYKDNVLIAGQTNPTYPVTAPGTYKVAIGLGATSCIAESEVKIEYAAPMNPSPATIVQCDDNLDGIAVFDLTSVDALVKAGDTTLSGPVYYENQTDPNPIADPAHYSSTAKTVYAMVSNPYRCSQFAPVTLQIANNTIAPLAPIATCDADAVQDGLYFFDFNAQVTPQVVNGLPAGLSVRYFADANDAALNQNPLPDHFPNTVPFQQSVWARIVNGPDCYGVIEVPLKVNTFSVPGFDTVGEAYLCDGGSTHLSVPSGYSGYLWDDASHSTSPTITVTSPDEYNVVVTDANGCTDTKKFQVMPSSKAVLDHIAIDDFQGGDNSVTIYVNGTGSYEYSLDGQNYQTDRVFTGVPSGPFTVYVNDTHGCGLLTEPIFVMDYPKFFTPNNDGYNDYWRIAFLQQQQPDAVVTIFDRYGKLVYAFSGASGGWDGKLNDRPLPATDYWFVIQLENNRIVRGHFALKR